MTRYLLYSVALPAFFLFSVAVHAEDYVLTLRNNQFSPKSLTIPANQKIKIILKNQDATPAEFESSDLNREKVVGANSEVIIFIGPLDVGNYGYFDDFHRDTTTGAIIAK
ncbi:MAG TPA: cupredoxin domain-containing protein [Rhodocyclaceae bacterium]|nr:cupredoxin domain-containing protein [Rhodocyclaceae bacterium]